MIDKLTPEQIDQIPEYVDKWLKIGLCTERVDKKRATEIMNYYYRNIAKKKTVPVVVISSPLAAWLAVCLHSGSQTKSEVWPQTWSQVDSQVRSQVDSQVRSQAESQVRSQVESQVRSQVWSQVRSQVRSQGWGFIYPYLDGHFSASYFSCFNYINEVLGIKYEVQDKYNWYQSTSELGLIYPLKDICLVSDRPCEIHMKNGLLHNENGMSIKYIDSFGCYSLNGIPMKAEYVLTPADEIKPESILKEENVDVRRELIRKVGLLRLCSYGEKLDKWNDYELIDMQSVTHEYSPYLLMRNKSIDTWHLEGVPVECKTVEQALNARKPEAMKNIPISINGDDWYQQGDVCIWRHNSIALKPYPTIIT